MKPSLSSIGALVAICLAFADPGARAQNGTFPKLESSFTITGISTDPVVLFDYTQTDVEVTISQPDSSTVTLPAFYDGGTTWRVRHTPTLPGTYQITAITLNGSPISVGGPTPSSWTVTGFPTNSGFVSVDPTNPRRFLTSNGRRYFPVGEDVAWDNGVHTVTAIFPKMGAAHENWSRVWMDHWDGKNLDWNSNGSSPGPLGALNLTVAQKWDSIVNAADANGIKFQMTLQHHGQYSYTVDPNWGQNPYNTTNSASTIGFLTNPEQFFTNATAKMITKRKLRYTIARWGYSPSIMGWELFNEVQFTTAGQNNHWSIIQSWHDEMAQFIRQQDPYHHLITTSSVLNEPIWDQTDYYQHHEYPNDLITGIRDAQDITASQPIGPDFAGECGINTTPHVGISPPVWAGLMSAQSGGAQPWYWDTSIDQNNDYFLIQAAADFVTRSGFGDQNVLSKTSPKTTGGPIGPLSFAPSGGWGTNMGPDTFVVGSTAPSGIGLSTQYLQGNGNRNLLTNGYTFFVNYPSSGTWATKITQIAKAGAHYNFYVDSVLTTNLNFASASADVNTNLTIPVTISAGAHTIKLANDGADWLVIGNLTLNPYAAQLGAYAVGNTNFQALWVWHRTNVFLASPGPAVTGTVDITGLDTGTYAATWWDTFGAGVISNFSISIPSPGATVTISTPSILRSSALYVGLPAQAGIVAPNLNQTVPTNTPAFTLPLTVTNGGGLPLSYSLSFTSAIPSWLSFSATNGYVSMSNSVTLSVVFNPVGLAPGTYTFTIFVNTGDPNLPVTVLPVTLTVSSGTTPPPPPNLSFVSGSATQIVFQLTGITGLTAVLQESPDLMSWNPISTNVIPINGILFTNPIPTDGSQWQQFWRAQWQQ